MSSAGGRVCVRLLIVAALAMALKHELTAAPETNARADGGISGAKRDYEALKAPAENTSERPKIDLPPAPTLELKVETSMPTTTLRGKKLTEEERLRELQREKEKTRNWLIEAMAKQEQPAAAAATPAETPTDGHAAELDRAAKLMAMLDAITASKSAGDRTTGQAAPAADLKESSPDVINPLDRYMASWMTAGDFKLLAPKSESGPAGGAELLPSLADSSGRAASQPFAELAPTTGRGAAMADNPYLRDAPALAPLPANLAELASPPTILRPNPIPPLIAPAAQPEPPPPPSFSEQLKAQDDAKYFKQLRRFLGLGFRGNGRLSRTFLPWLWHFCLQDKALRKSAWGSRSSPTPRLRARFTTRRTACSAGTWRASVSRDPTPI